MMLGMPVVGLATTELVTLIENGRSGFIDTRPEKLIEPMRFLLNEPHEARRIGQAGRHIAVERFSIERFARDWEATFAEVAGRPVHARALASLPAQPTRATTSLAAEKGALS
jgi:glycosyltransferase involved in cell wall biosynthesis